MNPQQIRARDAAVRRLRTATAAVGGVGAAVALGFGFMAAKAFPGRSSHTRSSHTAVKTVTRRSTAPAKPVPQAAPSLVSAGSPVQPQAPPAPASPAPAPAAAPPVAVSGGS